MMARISHLLLMTACLLASSACAETLTDMADATPAQPPMNVLGAIADAPPRPPAQPKSKKSKRAKKIAEDDVIGTEDSHVDALQPALAAPDYPSASQRSARIRPLS